MAKTPWPLEVARPQKEMSCQLSDIWSCEGQEICNGSCLLFTLAFFGDRCFFCLVWCGFTCDFGWFDLGSPNPTRDLLHPNLVPLLVWPGLQASLVVKGLKCGSFCENYWNRTRLSPSHRLVSLKQLMNWWLVPGTQNMSFLVDVWWKKSFTNEGLKSCHWRNQYRTCCLGYQVDRCP